jgi:thiol-disulfide isomerase/thioredoxin
MALLAAGVFLQFLLICGAPPSQAKVKLGSLPKEFAAKYPIRTTEGREYTLAGLRGQVVVLTFLAVWCAHSRDQMPALKRFDDEDHERGLKIIGLFINDQETSLARVQKFVTEQKVEFPVTIIPDFVGEKFLETKDLSTPQTLVYGRNGRLAAYFDGQSAEIDKALTEVVKQELEKKN